jgi:hypothetical protein
MDATRDCAVGVVEGGVVLIESIKRAKTEILRRAMSLIQANNIHSYVLGRGYYFAECRFLQDETKVGLKYIPTDRFYKSEGKRIRDYVCRSLRENGFRSVFVGLDEEIGGVFIIVDMKEIAEKMVPYLDQSFPAVTE